MTEKFYPLHDRVAVRRLEVSEKTTSGVFLPEDAREKPARGVVVAVGTGTVSNNGNVTPLHVKEGDEVLFGKWSGTEMKIGSEELLIMKESDILGVFKK